MIGFDIILLIFIFLYVSLASIKDYKFIKKEKLLFLAIYNWFFIIIVSYLLVIVNGIELINYWWAILILASPSFYFNYLKFKKNSKLGEFIKRIT